MNLPKFFADAPVIRVRDELSRLLGAPADGVLEYRYVDAVRLAGHSCPTVAGAYLMARAALRALYPDELPERGGIAVRMPEPEWEGTSGVTAQVLTLITGAAADNGFKGIGGRFARDGLLEFAPGSGREGTAVRFRRLDTGAVVAVELDAKTIPVEPAQQVRLAAILRDCADEPQRAAFAASWQERVRRLLLEHADDPAVIRVRPVASENQDIDDANKETRTAVEPLR